MLCAVALSSSIRRTRIPVPLFPAPHLAQCPRYATIFRRRRWLFIIRKFTFERLTKPDVAQSRYRTETRPDLQRRFSAVTLRYERPPAERWRVRTLGCVHHLALTGANGSVGD